MKKICSKLFANLFFAVFGMSSVLMATNGNVGNVANNASNVAYYQTASTTNFITIGGFNILFNESVNNLIKLGVFGPKEISFSNTYRAYTERITNLANLGNENNGINKINISNNNEYCLKYPSHKLASVYQEVNSLESSIADFANSSISSFNAKLGQYIEDEAKNLVNSLADGNAYHKLAERQFVIDSSNYVAIILTPKTYQEASFFVRNIDNNTLEKQNPSKGITIILRQDTSNQSLTPQICYEIVNIMPHYNFDSFDNNTASIENHFNTVIGMMHRMETPVNIVQVNNEGRGNDIITYNNDSIPTQQPQYNISTEPAQTSTPNTTTPANIYQGIQQQSTIMQHSTSQPTQYY